jgi:hypothetical protein
MSSTSGVVVRFGPSSKVSAIRWPNPRRSGSTVPEQPASSALPEAISAAAAFWPSISSGDGW